MRNWIHRLAVVALAAGLQLGAAAGRAAELKILNVSYDVTREFYRDFNASFAAYWKEKTGDSVTVNQSHGGSTKQAESVINGLEADVVTMNQPTDVDVLFSAGRLLPANWATRLPNRSVPYNSTIVFVVRKGNPKNITNWGDLIRPDVSMVIPNPKTSGNGRYSYLGAWGYALKKSAGDEKQARAFVAKLFANVPVLDTGGRGATTTFADRGIGDVLLTFESEAALVQKTFPDEGLEVVLPPISILVENPVTWVDRNVQRHHTQAVSRAYLEYLYSDAGQELAAQHFFRPRNQAILERYNTRYKPVELLTVEDIAGGWQQAQAVHFADGGIFDQIYQSNKLTNLGGLTGSPEVLQERKTKACDCTRQRAKTSPDSGRQTDVQGIRRLLGQMALSGTTTNVFLN